MVLEHGTEGGVSSRDTASLIGPTLMMKNGRWNYFYNFVLKSFRDFV